MASSLAHQDSPWLWSTARLHEGFESMLKEVFSSDEHTSPTLSRAPSVPSDDTEGVGTIDLLDEWVRTASARVQPAVSNSEPSFESSAPPSFS